MPKFRNSLGEEVEHSWEELKEHIDAMEAKNTISIPNDPENPKYYYLIEDKK